MRSYGVSRSDDSKINVQNDKMGENCPTHQGDEAHDEGRTLEQRKDGRGHACWGCETK